MSNGSGSEPLSITVYQRDMQWWARVEDDRGEPLDDRPLRWDGTGRFYEEGLNSVVGRIPKGYAYTEWNELPDGSQTAILKRIDPRFGL